MCYPACRRSIYCARPPRRLDGAAAYSCHRTLASLQHLCTRLLHLSPHEAHLLLQAMHNLQAPRNIQVLHPRTNMAQLQCLFTNRIELRWLELRDKLTRHRRAKLLK